MSTITGIEEARGRVEIYVDGLRAARVRRAHYEKCPLKVGDDFDADAWLDRVAAVQFPDAYEAALTSLDHSARTAKEMARALGQKGYVAPAVEAVVARLRECGLIDDARYARRMAETQSKKPMGVNAFKRKLMAKGVSEDEAEDALSAFDADQQREACLVAARSLWRKYADLPGREGRAKLSQALARRGFDWDTIEGTVDQIIDRI